MGRYLYCTHCGNYLGSLGADYCHLCDIKLVPDEKNDSDELSAGETE